MFNNTVKRFTRRCITLIEIMIVMFLIALITGVVAYNYRGTLEEGKAFKTKAGIEKLQTILSLTLADNPSADMSNGSWQNYIASSPLVHDAKSILKDGWGRDYDVANDENGNIVVRSAAYEDYIRKHPTTMFKN